MNLIELNRAIRQLCLGGIAAGLETHRSFLKLPLRWTPGIARLCVSEGSRAQGASA
jgi:hypothetical protein